MMPDNPSPRFSGSYVDPNSWTLKKVLLVIGSIIVAIFLWVYISSPLLTSVTGVGEVSAPATSATVSFNLVESGDTPEGAITSVKAKAESISSFLTTKGVLETDIAQGQVTAVPAAISNPSLTGFQASITMAAKTSHVSTISGLISDLYGNGASVVSQPVLSVDNEVDLEREAYKIAVKDAKSKAGKIALSNWKIFRKVISVTESSSGSTSTATTKPDTLAAEDPVALENGVFKIVSAVTITYKLW